MSKITVAKVDGKWAVQKDGATAATYPTRDKARQAARELRDANGTARDLDAMRAEALTERRAVAEWFRNGRKGPTPSTSNYDALSAKDQQAIDKEAKTSTRKGKEAAAVPPVACDEVLVPLRNERHAVTIAKVLRNLDNTSVDGPFLIVHDDEVVDAVAALEAARPSAATYDARILTTAAVRLREITGKVLPAGSPTSLAANLLNQAQVEWAHVGHPDGRTWFGVDGTNLTAREVLARFGDEG